MSGAFRNYEDEKTSTGMGNAGAPKQSGVKALGNSGEVNAIYVP